MYESKDVCIIHVISILIAKNLFNDAHSCAIEADLGVMLHVACDRETVRHSGSHVTGHVMDEIWNHIKIRLANNKVVHI